MALVGCISTDRYCHRRLDKGSGSGRSWFCMDVGGAYKDQKYVEIKQGRDHKDYRQLQTEHEWLEKQLAEVQSKYTSLQMPRLAAPERLLFVHSRRDKAVRENLCAMAAMPLFSPYSSGPLSD